MVGSSSWVQVSARPSLLSLSPVITHPSDSLSSSSSRSFLPHLPNRSWKKTTRVQASSSNNTGQDSRPSSSVKKNPLAVVLGIPGTIWKQTLRPLSDFGFGKKSVWEGGVGLFVVSGAVLLALSLAWLRGFQMRSRFRKYQAVLQFTEACGISTGTAVRIRGVTVGSVIRLNPSLKSIDAVIEVEDDKIFIPRNSLIEVNQSGLLMETMIDITPKDPLPTPSMGPLDTDCAKEGLIVCDKETIKGSKGVSLDELVGIFTRLGRDMEVIGVHKTFDLAERVASVIEEAKPLLAKIEAMAEDLEPLLSEVRDSGLLKEVEGLTKNLSAATEDMRKMHSSIMTPENTERIRKSIYSFLFTLKNIENISSDISGFTGDEPTRRNLKLLIKSLSRLL
ncbi:hypothetical protein C5167_000186 [Papaver somniferum]|uniref:Mce/MlaD domain-containing protein n=1 Tax=Papaver somniferum TaxID=3469 RepID=A0A4Y7KUC9_PAPSO|nr:protein TRIGALACTOSYLDIACYLGLYCEROL 2, chloroplastic-like [Papaver somniferum]RZC75788.1 hypothetical protein C5167_000186 [Papaver somniferum]